MKGIKYFLEFLLWIILFLIFKIIGFKNSSNIGGKIGEIFGPFIRSEKILKKNILNAFPNIDNNSLKKIKKDMWNNYGRTFAEYAFIKKFKNGKLEDNLKIEGIEILQKIIDEKKPVLFLSGHFANFELMAMVIERSGINLAAIYRPLNNFFIEPYLTRLRKNNICKVQIKKGLNGIKEIFRFLKNNYSIAMMIDQRVRQGERIDFFKKKAHTTNLPALLAKKFKCQIVTIKIKRYENYKFKITIEKPVIFSETETVGSITLKLNSWLERTILENPSQWIWTHDRWKN
jgi:KDO2-lipid IV(A) lauroyltransferase